MNCRWHSSPIKCCWQGEKPRRRVVWRPWSTDQRDPHVFLSRARAHTHARTQSCALSLYLSHAQINTTYQLSEQLLSAAEVGGLQATNTGLSNIERRSSCLFLSADTHWENLGVYTQTAGWLEINLYTTVRLQQITSRRWIMIAHYISWSTGSGSPVCTWQRFGYWLYRRCAITTCSSVSISSR